MMYPSPNRLFNLILSSLLQQKVVGSRAGEMRELLGVQMPFSPVDYFITNARRNVSPQYAAAETLWYLSQSHSTSMLKKFAPKYEMFEDIPGIALGAYGPRIMPLMKHVVDELSKPNSRRCVVPIFQDHDLKQSTIRKDIPCTVSLKFYSRGGHLTMITDMRSNDVWLGFPYDVFAFITIGSMIAKKLNLEFTRYDHNVGSLHLYERNAKAAEEALSANSETSDLRIEFKDVSWRETQILAARYQEPGDSIVGDSMVAQLTRMADGIVDNRESYLNFVTQQHIERKNDNS